MWPYFILLSLPIMLSVVPINIQPRLAHTLWFIVGVLFITFIGFRQQVGADWLAYQIVFFEIANQTIQFAATYSDPGYGIINWLSSKLGWGIWGANLICAAVFTFGLFKLCTQQKRPWLALAIATPYLVIVVAMGYSRQSVALGLVFYAFAIFKYGRELGFTVCILIAALFHKTAIIMLPFAFASLPTRKLWRYMPVITPVASVVLVLATQTYDQRYEEYILDQLNSVGATFRIALTLTPSVLYALLTLLTTIDYPDNKLWRWICIACILMVPLSLYSSTAADRAALYLSATQIVLLPRIIEYISNQGLRVLIVAAIVLFYSATLWIWLTYSSYSIFWKPYKNVLIPAL